MKTGTGRPCRHPVVLAAIFAGTLVLPLLLSGCDDHSPVAAPTSTLPAKESSADPTGDQATPSVPEYKTDLDLSAEDKKAVEGALTAFDGYIATINRVLSSGGKDVEGVTAYASESSLESLKKSAEDLEESGQYMAGTYDYYQVRIQAINLNSDNTVGDSVIVIYCTHDSDRAVVELDAPLPSQTPRSLTMKHTATKQGDDWKISNQELWSKECE